MSVVSGHPEYAPVLARMHALCFEHPWAESEFCSLLQLPTTMCWISEQAFLMCSVVQDEMEILTIGVLPAYRRQHIGQKLLEEMIAYADSHKIQKIFLEVSIRNEAAQALYAKVGFRQTGVRPGYYQTESGSADALCLTRFLSE